jgi:hypothetical protein
MPRTKKVKYTLSLEASVNGKVGTTTFCFRDAAGNTVHSDQAKVQSDRDRRRLIRAAADKLDVPEDVLTRLVEGECNRFLDDARRRKEQEEEAARAAAAAPPPEEDPEADGRRLLAETPAGLVAEARALLRDPNLLDRTADDVGAQGVAGERELSLALYLVYTSRKLKRPLSARVRGPSASGKNHVIDRVADLMPAEAVIRATQMTTNALFYMKPGSLRHKLIVAGERSRNEQDEAADATRALREMISAGRLSKLLPVKTDGGIETVLVEQMGPVAFVESTTLGEVFAEDENRALALYTDERPEQTRRILDELATRHAGLSAGGRDAGHVRDLHHTAQRLLERREVVIPFAGRLASRLKDDRVETRRAFPAVLSMIQASALLHQFQREQTAGGCVVAGPTDYIAARMLLAVPMRRLLGDGISEQVKRFAERLRGWFKDETFTFAQARAKEVTSRSSVYGWLREMRTAGLVEQVSEARGRTAGTWKLTNADLATANVLPTAEQVFDAKEP